MFRGLRSTRFCSSKRKLFNRTKTAITNKFIGRPKISRVSAVRALIGLAVGTVFMSSFALGDEKDKKKNDSEKKEQQKEQQQQKQEEKKEQPQEEAQQQDGEEEYQHIGVDYFIYGSSKHAQEVILQLAQKSPDSDVVILVEAGFPLDNSFIQKLPPNFTVIDDHEYLFSNQILGDPFAKKPRYIFRKGLLIPSKYPKKLEIPIPIKSSNNIIPLADVDELDLSKIRDAKHITVLGSGHVGSRVAYILRKHGKEVVNIAPNGVLGSYLPSYLSDHQTNKFRENGITVLTGSRVKEIVRSNDIKDNINNNINNEKYTVLLEDNRTIETDVILSCTGREIPRDHLMTMMRLEGTKIGRFLITNNNLLCERSFYAVGEAVSHYDKEFGRNVLVNESDIKNSLNYGVDRLLNPNKPTAGFRSGPVVFNHKFDNDEYIGVGRLSGTKSTTVGFWWDQNLPEISKNSSEQNLAGKSVANNNSEKFLTKLLDNNNSNSSETNEMIGMLKRQIPLLDPNSFHEIEIRGNSTIAAGNSTNSVGNSGGNSRWSDKYQHGAVIYFNKDKKIEGVLLKNVNPDNAIQTAKQLLIDNTL